MREWLGDECVDKRLRVFHRVLPGADGDDVRVIVFAREAGDVQIPDERRPGADDIVRGDLLSIAGATEDDSERHDTARLIGDDGECRGYAEARIVVEGVVGGGAVINDLVARIREVSLQIPAEVQTCMVGSDVDAHCHSLSGPDDVAPLEFVCALPRRRIQRQQGHCMAEDRSWMVGFGCRSAQPEVTLHLDLLGAARPLLRDLRRSRR